MQQLSHLTYLVYDYDKAIEFFTKKLSFTLVCDTPLDETKRWVIVAPGNKNSCGLLLAKATNKIQEKAIGNQSGGRVFLFLQTDDFEKDYENLLFQNIKIVRPPKKEAYGNVVVFEDLYGNHWDLIEPFKK